MVKITATVLGYIFLLAIAGVVCWFGYMNIARLYYVVSERSWHSVDAVIISSETEWKSQKSGKLWAPSWTFSYSANGQSYVVQSSSLPYGYNTHWYNTEALASQAGQVRAKGTIVTAYYDPDAPKRSVLDRATWDIGDWWVLGCSILAFMLVGQFLQKAYVRSHSASYRS